VNTHAKGSTAKKQMRHSHWLLAALLIVIAGGWWFIGHPGFRTAPIKEQAEQVVQEGHLDTVKSDLKTFEDDMRNGKFDEAAQVLSQIKQVAAKDADMAALELRLTSSRISKAISDGHLDRANAALHEAEQSGKVAAEELAKWHAEISAAVNKDSTSSSSASSPSQ
jgi:hypothetical protein